jgi:hypothetical protein
MISRGTSKHSMTALGAGRVEGSEKVSADLVGIVGSSKNLLGSQLYLSKREGKDLVYMGKVGRRSLVPGPKC